jgi:hypothetical protein
MLSIHKKPVSLDTGQVIDKVRVDPIFRLPVPL